MNKDLFFFSNNSVSMDDDFAMHSGLVSLFAMDNPVHTDREYISFCLGGSGEIEINLKKRTVVKNDLVFVSRNSIISDRKLSEDFRFVFFSMSNDFMRELLNDLRKYPPVFMLKQNFPSIHLSGAEMEQLMGVFNVMWKQTEDVENGHRREIVKHLLCSILINIHWLARRYMDKSEPISRKEEMVRDFFTLIFEHYKEAKDVSFYADKLCVSSKYLSSLVKKVAGHPAKECIDYCVIMECKVMLRSSRTIQEISQEFNFPNQSFFGKYFKKHTGMSPVNYRNSILKEV